MTNDELEALAYEVGAKHSTPEVFREPSWFSADGYFMWPWWDADLHGNNELRLATMLEF